MKLKKYLGVVLCFLLLASPLIAPVVAPDIAPSLSQQAWADGVTSSVAGAPGMRFYTTTFTASGSYIPASSTIRISGCAAGGGGAGGWSNSTGGGGGGGSGAVCVSNMLVHVTPNTALTITIGTTGVGGAIASVGGTASLNTTIAGLPIGTLTIPGATAAATAGAAGAGGTGGNVYGAGGGAGGSGAANGTASNNQLTRITGSDAGSFVGGSGGGGNAAPNAGGTGVFINPYQTFAVGTSVIAAAAGSGNSGGGGHGGGTMFGVGALGGSLAIGATCTVGYGGGGGGGAANFAGGNGCPGVLWIDEWK